MTYAQAAFAGKADLPEIPSAAERCWSAFNEMRGAVKYDSPISHSEMHAYCVMAGARLRLCEVSWIRDLDRAWMERAAAKAREAAQRGRQPQAREVKIDDFAGIDRMLARQARHG